MPLQDPSISSLDLLFIIVTKSIPKQPTTKKKNVKKVHRTFYH